MMQFWQQILPIWNAKHRQNHVVGHACVNSSENLVRIKEDIMKKKLSLMLAAALTAGLALTGCGGSKTSDTIENTASAESETAAEVKGVDVDTTGYLVAALNADIQTADVQKTSKDY